MKGGNYLSFVLVVGVLLGGARAQIGGNGLCPTAITPGSIAGGLSPVENPSSNPQVVEAAQLAAEEYLTNSTQQNSVDATIISTCQPNITDAVDSVQVLNACSQVVAGTNYLVEFELTIPCSDANAEQLPNGTNTTLTLVAQVYEPLPSSNETASVTFVESEPQAPEPESPAPESFCSPDRVPGGVNAVEDPSSNDQVQEAAKLAAASYFNETKTGDNKKAFEACSPTEAQYVDSIRVSEACIQVVAGTNVLVRFTTTIPCTDAATEKLPAGFILKQGFEAEVFIPLPSSNEAPEVKTVTNTGGLLGETVSETSEPLKEKSGSVLQAQAPLFLGIIMALVLL